jgi:predicted RNA-binding protein Jag
MRRDVGRDEEPREPGDAGAAGERERGDAREVDAHERGGAPVDGDGLEALAGDGALEEQPCRGEDQQGDDDDEEALVGPAERADLEAAEASPEALGTGKEILEELMRHIGFAVKVEVETGDTSRLNVVADPDGREALGSLIGRKGERLSALQHLVNLMLSRRMGEWTRVLVDVEDYRGRRERQLRDLANRAASRVEETGKMIQLEQMPALERRWIHLALRDHPQVATQSIGEEPNRRIVVLLRGG